MYSTNLKCIYEQRIYTSLWSDFIRLCLSSENEYDGPIQNEQSIIEKYFIV